MNKSYIYEQKSILKTTKLWLNPKDAASLGNPANDDLISQWDGLTGGSFTNGTPANQPIYKNSGINGLPSIKFDGVNDDLSGSFTALNGANSHTTFAVFSKPTDNQGVILVNNDTFLTGAGLYMTNNTSPNGYRYLHRMPLGNSGGDNLSVGTMPINTPQIMTAIRDANAGTQEIFVNGISQGSISSLISGAFNGLANLTIGSNSGTVFYDGYIGEIIIFDRALSVSQRMAIEKYLSSGWNINLT